MYDTVVATFLETLLLILLPSGIRISPPPLLLLCVQLAVSAELNCSLPKSNTGIPAENVSSGSGIYPYSSIKHKSRTGSSNLKLVYRERKQSHESVRHPTGNPEGFGCWWHPWAGRGLSLSGAILYVPFYTSTAPRISNRFACSLQSTYHCPNNLAEYFSLAQQTSVIFMSERLSYHSVPLLLSLLFQTWTPCPTAGAMAPEGALSTMMLIHTCLISTCLPWLLCTVASYSPHLWTLILDQVQITSSSLVIFSGTGKWRCLYFSN